MTGARLPVYVEAGEKRCFACVIDWPGWCRSGKDEGLALEALLASAPRYSEVAGAAGLAFPAPARMGFDVVERVPGSAMTDFGVPWERLARDFEPLTAAQARRIADVVDASWRVLDNVVAHAPASLRKGPRGGGRDRDKIFAHVVAADRAYMHKLGLRGTSVPKPGDRRAVLAYRQQVVHALRDARSGAPVEPKGWPPRYAARRIAWHAVDHAWEIEDRS